MRFLKFFLMGILVSSPLFGANIKKYRTNFTTTYSIIMTETETVHLKEKGDIISIEGINDSRCPEGKICLQEGLWPGAIIFNLSLFDLNDKTFKNLELYYQETPVEINSKCILSNVVKNDEEYMLEIEFKD